MATVYRGFDPRFEREVAIKILPLEMVDDPQFRARFEREARAIAALEHPCIVPVYDFAEDNGQPFIVMRLMKGGSLADRLKEGPFTLVEAQRVLHRLGQALDAAHRRGIIHRDLKPGNILFDEYDNAYLSDFGIAHIANAGATLTGTGVIGTPAYMSPEQVQSDAPLDPRSDVYALGIILYQMLSGQTPFRADTPARVMMAHLLETPQPILDLRPDLPEGCQQVLETALAKDRDERYTSAGALAEAFKAVVLGEAPTPPVQAHADTTRAAPTRVARPNVLPQTPTAAARQAHSPARETVAASGRRFPLAAVLGGVLLLGALVAGLGAGRIHNSWPLMEGRLVPEGLFEMVPWYLNLFENRLTVQFDHRLMAYFLFGMTLFYAILVSRITGGILQRGAWMVFGLLCFQIGWGIFTLLMVAPFYPSLIHQALGMLVFLAMIWHVRMMYEAYRTGRA